MLKTSEYQMLQVLYKTGSITTAAKELFISQPALTKRIRKIEEELEVTIVKRNVKGIVFTQEGEYLINYANKMLAAYRDLRRDLHGLQQNQSRTISIMSAGSLSTSLLPDLLKAFKQETPSVQYVLRTMGSNQVVQNVCERRCDVGFARGEPWLDCMRDPIRTEYATVIYSDEIDLDMLPYLPRIDPEMSESARHFLNSWWYSTYDVVPYIPMKVPNITTCVEMVRAGLGYSILVSADVYRDVPDIRRKRLLDKTGNYVTRRDYILYRPDDSLNQITKEFIAFSREYFQKMALEESCET